MKVFDLLQMDHDDVFCWLLSNKDRLILDMAKMVNEFKSIMRNCDGNNPEHEELYNLCKEIVKRYE